MKEWFHEFARRLGELGESAGEAYGDRMAQATSTLLGKLLFPPLWFNAVIEFIETLLDATTDLLFRVQTNLFAAVLYASTQNLLRFIPSFGTRVVRADRMLEFYVQEMAYVASALVADPLGAALGEGHRLYGAAMSPIKLAKIIKGKFSLRGWLVGAAINAGIRVLQMAFSLAYAFATVGFMMAFADDLSGPGHARWKGYLLSNETPRSRWKTTSPTGAQSTIRRRSYGGNPP